jgi:hypothetical protein
MGELKSASGFTYEKALENHENDLSCNDTIRGSYPDRMERRHPKFYAYDLLCDKFWNIAAWSQGCGYLLMPPRLRFNIRAVQPRM